MTLAADQWRPIPVPERTGHSGDDQMLLEQLVEKAGKEPEHDWEAYYGWLVSAHAGREIEGYAFWQCQKCLTTNVLLLPARYGKCRCCDLIHLP